MSRPLPFFSKARVLVVGDIMLDRYWIGETTRISPEAPVPVARIESVRETAGGAGNVALNIAALDATATLVGIVGEDEPGHSLQRLLAEKKVQTRLVTSHQAMTITKLRVLSRHQQLIRLDFEKPAQALPQAGFLETYQQALLHQDAVILSDYQKGTLAQVQTLIQLAKQQGLPVLIDPKGNDFSKYRGATLLTPNLKEFETIVGHCQTEAELEAKGYRLIETLELAALLITRSERGMTLLEPGQPALHIPTQARDVFDVTGAGDTVIGVLAAALAVGQPLKQAVFWANLAAGLVVGKLGAATVNVAELEQALDHGSEKDLGIVTESRLKVLREKAREQGHTIVMTNGCFDLLHAGHVSYLREAKALGDYLIVAVNDDDSVKRLKGPSRPIVPLAERMAVLAGLKAVDYVIPFSEETPTRLIESVLPDILVKGGDYRPEDVAGGKAVQAAGGEVKILSFKPGCSTSNLVKTIIEQSGEKTA